METLLNDTSERIGEGRSKYLTYKEWKPDYSGYSRTPRKASKYLTYKEWKLFPLVRYSQRLFRALRSKAMLCKYLTYKEWKHLVARVFFANHRNFM